MKALVTLDPDSCPACSGPLTEASWTELPLLRHGGYGAARFHRLRSCSLGHFSVLAEVSEVHPHPRTAAVASRA